MTLLSHLLGEGEMLVSSRILLVVSENRRETHMSLRKVGVERHRRLVRAHRRLAFPQMLPRPRQKVVRDWIVILQTD